MTIRVLAAMAAAGLLVYPGSGVAQSTQSAITFTMPVNLTKLSPDIPKIKVTCGITSAANPRDAQGNIVALQNTMEFPASGGQVVTTATVVVAVPPLDNPVGKSATYTCGIQGFSTLYNSYGVFRDGAEASSAAYPMFVVSPVPYNINGTFVW